MLDSKNPLTWLSGVAVCAGLRGAFLILVLLSAGCHFKEALKDAKDDGTLGTVVGLIPGAIAGNPAAWVRLAGLMAAFVGVAVAGHHIPKVLAKRKVTKKALTLAVADYSKRLADSPLSKPTGAPGV